VEDLKMADERYKTVSTFTLPDEYQRQASEARRRRRMAEMLAQQAYQPGDIQNAPIPRGAPLVRGLQAFLAARAARKADEAEESAEEKASQIGSQIAGRLTGREIVPAAPGVPVDSVALEKQRQIQEEKNLLQRNAEEQAQLKAGDIQEVTRQSQYVYDPQDAMRLAMTRGGNAAIRGNPMLAAMLAKTMEKPDSEKFYAPVVDSAGNFVQFPERGGAPRTSKIAAQARQETLSELGRLLLERQNPRLSAEDRKIYDTKISNFISQKGLSQSEIANLNLGILNAQMKAVELGQNLPAGETLPVVPPTVQGLLNYGGRRQFGGDVRAGKTYLVGEQGPELVKFNQPGTVVPNPATTRSVIQRTSPKERMKLEQQQPTDKKSVLNALGQVSMMKNLVKDLQKHGGVDYIFGPVMSRLPNVRGSATSAQSLYDTLLERTSTETMKQNRQEGFAPGSITVQEWPRFESALAPLKSTKDPVAMRRALENADAQLESIEQRIIDNYQSTYGEEFPLDYSPPSYKFESELYPSPEVKKQKQDIYNRADAILQQMQNRRQ
jgi:hypothetical protein